jgi:hypothetical protein
MNELLIVDKLRHYAALEIRRGESESDVIRNLLAAMEAGKKPCIGIEALGRYSIGGRDFVRFRSDVEYAPSWLPDRGCIIKDSNGGFVLRVPSGRGGRVPPAPMFMASMQRRTYHGTVQKDWRLQFAS